MNRKQIGPNSKGCSWQPKRQKWIARIGFAGKKKTLGYFETEADAAAAYAAAAKKLHGEYMRIA